MTQIQPLTHDDFRARQTTLELNGIFDFPVRIAYTDVGEGSPILLLHGIPTWSYLYNDVIPLLAQHYRVIAPDMLGHGWSDRRDRFDRSLVVQAQMVRQFLDTLGLDRVNLVGHDTGGGVSLILGIEAPERIHTLTLTNIVAYDSWPIDDMLMVGHPRWKHKPVEEIVAYLEEGLKDGLSRPDRLTSEFRAGIIAPYADPEGQLSLIRNASSLNTNHTMALVDRHCDIPVPTLLLWGEDDPWQPVTDGERLAKEIPNAKLVRIKNASHWLPQDAPKEFAEAIATFLQDS
ncbi:MAG: alpha/beta fold hydrolase [Elainellaceae cyanobacterium]